MRSHLWMAIGLVAGLLLGLLAAALAEHHHPALFDALVAIQPIGEIFKNLLSMVAIPLVATALFAGLAKLGELRMLGRLVVRTLTFFWTTSILAIVLGFAVGSVMLPRAAVSPERQAVLKAAAADPGAIQRAAQTLPTGVQFIVQLVPANPFKAAADGNLLPVIVFVTIFAIATATLPHERRVPLTVMADSATEALIRIVQWVLVIAPIGIFALVAPTAARYGWEIVRAMLWFIAAVIVGVILFHALVYLPGVALFARLAPARFLRVAFPSMFMGFSATTSLAALPNLFEAADKDLHLPRSVSGFVLPLGASINRAGSALFQAIAVLFIARVYGIPFGTEEMLSAGLAVFLASLTVAAVPSGGVISLFPAFQATGLPIAGLSILMGLDRISDMFRTMTNVTGHLATAVVVAPRDPPSA
ncbi:MAG TPA: dicarboxylate/amino acid:cation symporter [Gemmatimonadales bacterium]|nr:dicarboxylate/amino acid:cation symporter [Gemmatimonadales bacterium]